MYLNSYFKESDDGAKYRAEIHQEEETRMYFVEYYVNGNLIKTEKFQNSVHYVTDAVHNWIDGIKILNG